MKKLLVTLLFLKVIMLSTSIYADEASANKRDVKIIMIHGNGSSTPDDHWFPWVKAHLEAMNFDVSACQFPDTQLARAAYWLPFLKNELQVDQNTILIGLSSGAIAAMRYAESNKLLGTILVAGYHTDLSMKRERLSGYFDEPWQWDTIKNNQEWVIQFASADDPWIPIEEARFIH